MTVTFQSPDPHSFAFSKSGKAVQMHCERKQLMFWPFIHSNITKLPGEQWLSGILEHALIVTITGKCPPPCLVDGKALWKPGFFKWARTFYSVHAFVQTQT